MKMESVKEILYNYPFRSLSASFSGYLLSLTEYVSPLLRFLILLFSTITALSLAYIHYNKAMGIYYGKKKKGNSKKGNRNSR